MQYLIRTLILLAGLAAPICASAADLTEASIKKLISRVDQGIASMDTPQIAAAFSDDARITLHISVQGHRRTMRISKPQYIDMLRQNWSMFDHYSYSRSNVKITIHGFRAMVTDNVRETITSRGQSLSATSKEEVTIELVNGRPLVTSVVGYTNM